MAFSLVQERHLTRPDQGLSLGPGGRRKRNPGNEIENEHIDSAVCSQSTLINNNSHSFMDNMSKFYFS